MNNWSSIFCMPGDLYILQPLGGGDSDFLLQVEKLRFTTLN